MGGRPTCDATGWLMPASGRNRLSRNTVMPRLEWPGDGARLHMTKASFALLPDNFMPGTRRLISRPP